MSEYLETITHNRNLKDEFFRTHHDSPLPEEMKPRFKGLNYFSLNKKLRFKAVQIAEFQNPKEKYPMPRTGGDLVHYFIFGRIRFGIDDKNYDLVVYINPEIGHDYYFVPFWDETALANETYGSGRYLELEKSPDGMFTLDFNLAYNPFCVYSPDYSCPLTPQENRLKVRIEAGEKNFYK